MNQTRQALVSVKIVRPAMEYMGAHGKFQTLDIPSRSRLYGLEPRGMETVWSESLTSYINRLGWAHRVSPGELVAQELLPHLGSDYPSYQLTAFCRHPAIVLHGNGEQARKWSTLLERLTGQSDLSHLTLQRWIGNLSSRGQLQRNPAWCSACYMQWREQEVPVYQPLLWQYQVVSICAKHKQPLETYCPQCHRFQSVISTKRFQPGACTQCGAWLGVSAGTQSQRVNDEEAAWQQWVLHALEELYGASSCREPPQWERFFAGLATCFQEPGASFRLERLTGINCKLLNQRLGSLDDPTSYAPSLKTILKFCYTCYVTPLQIMSNQLTSLKALVQKRAPRATRHPQPAPSRINRQKCLDVMQAILDGREKPVSIRQLAKRLGYGDRTLAYNFPHECALIIKRAQEYRQKQQEQRRYQICVKVRQTVMTLHAQGIFPSRSKVGAMLPAGWIRRPEARMTWDEVLRELGLKD